MNSSRFLYGLVIGIIYFNLVRSWSVMELTGITNSNEGPFQTEWKVTRMNKTTYTINGPCTLTEDFTNAYDVEMRIHYSRMGNNQYIMLPFSFARTPLCDFWDGLYRRAFSKLIEQCSDFPKQIDGQPLCPMMVKGTYTLTNYPMDKTTLSSNVYQDGLYKFEFVVMKSRTSVVVSRMLIYIKLT